MTRRIMHMTPLEPRTAGKLKGFGFTITFEEVPAADQGGQESGALDSLPAKSNVANQIPVEPGGVHIPHNGSVG